MSEQATKVTAAGGKSKKQLTPKQTLAKKIIGWTVNILCIAIIIFSLIFTIVTIVRTTNDKGVANMFGTVFMPVKTESMSGTFEVGDLILSDIYEGDGSDLEVGQVISYKKTDIASNKPIIVTHRISRIVQISNGYVITVYGDKDGINGATENVASQNVVATWGTATEDGKIWKGMGKMSNWLEDPVKGQTRFFCAIILPLILLFIGYAFILIRSLVIGKISAAKEAAAAAATNITVDSLSDDEKRRLAEEYLLSLSRSKADNAEMPVADRDDATLEDISGDSDRDNV